MEGEADVTFRFGGINFKLGLSGSLASIGGKISFKERFRLKGAAGVGDGIFVKILQNDMHGEMVIKKKWIVIALTGTILVVVALILSTQLKKIEQQYPITVYEFKTEGDKFFFIDKKGLHLEVARNEFIKVRILSLFVFWLLFIGAILIVLSVGVFLFRMAIYRLSRFRSGVKIE